MNNISFHQRPVGEEPLGGIVRLIRQVCVLREQGDVNGAVRLQEHELATTIRDLRLAQGPETLPESELQALFAAEERRVVEAAILSELLVPRLIEALPVAPVRTTPAGARPIVRPASAASSVAAIPADPPAIPDLLDAMLAAERNGRR